MVRAFAMTRATALAFLLGSAGLTAASCSGDDASTITDAGAGADAPVYTPPVDAGLLDIGAPDADTTPYYNSDGWIGLQGFDRACGIYIAPSPSAKNFPPPIAWEPCDSRIQGLDGGSLVCEQMADNWGSGIAPDSGKMPFSYVASAYVDRTTQAVFLPVNRGSTEGGLSIVAEADWTCPDLIDTRSMLLS
jgi:hypothetical protein